MVNSRAGTVMSLVEKYTNASTWTEKVFTLPTSDDMTNTAYYQLVLSLRTTAPLILRIKINGNGTSTYYSDGRGITAGTETLFNVDAASTGDLNEAGSTIADRVVNGTINIFFNKGGTLNYVEWLTNLSMGSGIELRKGILATIVTGITSIGISVNTSTIAAGSHLDLYKVSR